MEPLSLHLEQLESEEEGTDGAKVADVEDGVGDGGRPSVVHPNTGDVTTDTTELSGVCHLFSPFSSRMLICFRVWLVDFMSTLSSLYLASNAAFNSNCTCMIFRSCSGIEFSCDITKSTMPI